MQLNITLNLDNAAFEEGGTDEAKRAVNRALEKLRGQWASAPVSVSIMDINGNKVGEAEVEG